MSEEDIVKLGGSIELSGFNVVDGGSMTILKKIIGNHVRKMEDKCKNFQGLKLTLKTVHQTEEKPKNFEIHGQLIDNGQIYPSKSVENNLFSGIGTVLNKLESLAVKD